ncbi:MAG: DNA polymerase III subunit gamma/tau [Proteobacteria bacterium]|nr:DNA polymerase III subunit gamma/tau [Pseudomonadota bacterium]
MSDMFGGLPEDKGGKEYLVLARKYRPQTFADLKGQEALVTTLTNAIKANRIHHAYVLTGIRGVGKTTTARIMAKALNCEGGPAPQWAAEDPQCTAIANGRHVDVLEFDAASYTGVDDIRDLFEGVGYQPVQGRYKIYIIDEVHMLSRQAFNALLKTLEEPPAHVKFIFATTEVNKIPVTVLSRCQRFDLRRVPMQVLQQHFGEILQKEELQASEAALTLIARAADGSVRDGLSLLDQAIALAAGQPIDEVLVTSMLGLADKGRLYDLLENLLTGQTTPVVEVLADMYSLGHDPLLLISELMELCHLLTRLKAIPKAAEAPDLTELDRTRGVELAAKLRMESLARAYQMLLTGLNEAKNAVRPFEAVEMAFIRIAYLAPVPAVDILLGKSMPAADASPQPEQPAVKKPEPPIAAAPPPIPAVATGPAPWEDDEPEPAVEEVVPQEQVTPQAQHADGFADWDALVSAVSKARPYLGAELAKKGRPVKLDGQRLDVYLPDAGFKTGAELAKELATTLEGMTGSRWQVNLAAQANGETVSEKKERVKVEKIRQAREAEPVRRVMNAFPGADVVDVIQPENED